MSTATDHKQGIREHLGQFSLHVLLVFATGLTIGSERTVVPALGEDVLGVESFLVIGSFVVSFGIVKSILNLYAGKWARSTAASPCLSPGGPRRSPASHPHLRPELGLDHRREYSAGYQSSADVEHGDQRQDRPRKLRPARPRGRHRRVVRLHRCGRRRLDHGRHRQPVEPPTGAVLLPRYRCGTGVPHLDLPDQGDCPVRAGRGRRRRSRREPPVQRGAEAGDLR